MADYVIWGKVEQVGPQEFLGIVSAVPANLVIPDVTVETNVSDSRETAVEFTRFAAVNVGRRVRDRGDRVIDVEVD